MRKILTVTVAFLLLSFAIVMPASAAAPPLPNGTVTVTINAPEGVAVNVALFGATSKYALKPRLGTKTTTTVEVPVGSYTVNLPRVVQEGTSYVGQSSVPTIGVFSGRTSTFNVTYVPEAGANQLHATDVAPNSVTLEWAVAPGSTMFLRRTTGTAPPVTPWQGIPVPITDNTRGTDPGLQPGMQYSYALFTQDRTGLHGPLTMTAGTTPPPGTSSATHVEKSGSVLAAKDVVSAFSIGDALRVRLADGVAVPTLGQGFGLPILSSLPDGFLGTVRAMSPDGKTVDLVPGALSDVFDFYDLSVNDGTPRTKDFESGEASTTFGPCAAKAKATLSLTASLALDGGHFETHVSWWKAKATASLGLGAKATGKATIKAEGALDCEVELFRLHKQLVVAPVPITLELSSKAELNASGKITVDNLGVTAKAGLEINASVGLFSSPEFHADPILDITPMTPTVTGTAEVKAKLGGVVVVGVGLDAGVAGIYAGVKGEFDPVNADFKLKGKAGGGSAAEGCGDLSVQFTREISLTARAWILGHDLFNKDFPIDALSGATDYPGMPVHFGTPGCSTDADPPAATSTTTANPNATLASTNH